ncbi:MAG TPA: hypothetical protein VGJ20_23375 [Xanthobacteraceae bacterium]
MNSTKAVERCNVARPALTRAMKTVEIELGGELLRRERKCADTAGAKTGLNTAR